MAIDETGGSEDDSSGVGVRFDESVTLGEYSWSDFRRDEHDEGRFDRSKYLGFDPRDTGRRLQAGASGAKTLNQIVERYRDPASRDVIKGEYTWEHFKQEYYYDEEGLPPREDGEKIPFRPEEYLGFHPEETDQRLGAAGDRASKLAEIVEERTVNVNEEVDEDAFFSTRGGGMTVANRYDLEKAVPMEKKTHFIEQDRYWVNKPYAFIVIFKSQKENEIKYYVVEPHLNSIEEELLDFLSQKLKTAIKYSEDEVIVQGSEADRAEVIQREAERLLRRYDLYEGRSKAQRQSPTTESERGGLMDSLRGAFGGDETNNGADPPDVRADEADPPAVQGEAADPPAGSEESGGPMESLKGLFGGDETNNGAASAGQPTTIQAAERQLEGISVRPEPAIIEDDPDTLSEYQVEKLLYVLKRNFIGYSRIDPIKHDINVEDISCDGYNSRVFAYHTDYEQIITNVKHGKEELDDFVVKLAQRSGKGISKRQPQVDATLPDGSRAQLTLGAEVSDHGTNYTIRQFKDVPFTPVDLINWNTFNLDEMAFLWLCIENHKSLIFAGGTASGKTTSLNAVSLFIPSSAKIVSIEDTREVELPQRNWVASVTRPSFGEDDTGDVDEFDLLEAALRQRPDYIVMGEIRGEEGRTAFQVMSTGHTTYTTFHADSVGEVIKRFTTDPINVSKTLFTALDLVSIQTQTRVDGHKVRRNKVLTEINEYSPENDEINVRDVYEWRAETDNFIQMGSSSTLEEIKFDRGWSDERLNEELFKRKTVLAYLIQNGLNTYTEVAATVQAFINDPETILAIIAQDKLERSLEDLREMESVKIDVDPEEEDMVPRPDPGEELLVETDEILSQAEPLLQQYRDMETGDLVAALSGANDTDEIEPDPEEDSGFDFGQFVPKAGSEAEEE
ncbi:secretion system protein [Halovenus sp. WSH3]|uniref:Secretion system protein n=1 Tax=Halovenus carboxidivorans TaxID=2692199 RepID=A0A6B0T0E2_9EURY|nr:type II/IV secretion system ATPase subunit [Halovenus carboxidivorans]MXR51638.1 secretion system protein [Halovenus carboxidivorans]